MTIDANATPLMVVDRRDLTLTCQIIDGKLRLHHGDRDLHKHRGTVVVAGAATSPVEVTVHGFVHGGKRFRVSAFSVGGDGALERWPSTEDGCVTMVRDAPATMRFVVIATSVDGLEVYSDDYPIVRVDPMGSSPDAK